MHSSTSTIPCHGCKLGSEILGPRKDGHDMSGTNFVRLRGDGTSNLSEVFLFMDNPTKCVIMMMGG